MLDTRLELVKTVRKNALKFWSGKRLKKRNQYWQQCPGDFVAKMPRGAWKKFSMLCCLQFWKSTLQHELDLVGIHGWHFKKILSNTSSILHPCFTFYAVRLSNMCPCPYLEVGG